MPPRTAGFGNRDRFELNGTIGLDCTGRQDNSASGMLPASICFKPGEDRVRTENRVCIQNHPRHRVVR
jgi:hypothetical protein